MTTAARSLDQFYTAPAVAQSLFQTLLKRLGRKVKGLTFVEPSAGAGAFFEQFPEGSIGLDLDPHCPGVEQADFFDWTPEDPAAPMVFVGNPPFGKNASLAVKFFNRAASFAGTSVIAFVVPRSFEKESVQKRLARAFHLTHQEVLPAGSFVFQGEPYDVPCVFQVWERLSDADRVRVAAPVEAARTHPDFRLLPDDDRFSADFAIQRVGSAAGAVKDTFGRLSTGSHYFVRAADRFAKDEVRAVFERLQLDGAWDAVKARSAGNPSIAQGELVAGYAAALPGAAPTVFERLNDLHEESGISEEARRGAGVVYTPVALARSCVRMARLQPEDRVLEVSVGRGAFVFAVLDYWVHEQGWTWEQTDAWARGHLFAQDIDPQAVSDLADLYESYMTERGVVGASLRANLRVGDALFEGWSQERFDVTIGNPPYLRTTAMPSAYRDRLRAAFPTSCGKGLCDAYYAFVEQCTRQSDRSVLVVPSSWMSNRHADGVRALLRPRVRAVIDFGMRLVFGAAAAVYTSVVVTGPETRAPMLYRENLPEEGSPWEVFFRDDAGPLDDTGWYFGKDRDLDGLLRGDVEGPTLDDLAIVHSGVNTSADKAFLVEGGEVVGERVRAVDPITGKTVHLPLALTPRFLKLNRLHNRAKLDASTDRMIAPYDAAWRLVPEDRLGGAAHGWLSARRDPLDARGTKGVEDWYAFGRRAGLLTLDPDLPVLLVTCWPCETLKPIRITPREISPDGRFLFVGGFVVQPRNPADIDRVQAILESESTWRAIYRYGRPKKSTRPYHTYTAALLRLVPAVQDGESEEPSPTVATADACVPGENKKAHGQFYTTSSPFDTVLFKEWLAQIPPAQRASMWLEPFAGAGNLPLLLSDVRDPAHWDCFDIEPGAEHVVRRDTLRDFPEGYAVAVTNPPYLAKNSATRSGLSFPACAFDDLYKLALERTLSNVGYVAAIVPDSFMTTGLFRDRLFGVTTLRRPMFDETECPVCLALFVPAALKKGEDFLWSTDGAEPVPFETLRGSADHLVSSNTSVDWVFNAAGGSIGLYAADGTAQASIRFVRGETIDDASVKSTGRHVTKIGGLPRDVPLDALLDRVNALLEAFRTTTGDALLTAHRGMRADGMIRRRLGFAAARALLNAAVERVRRARADASNREVPIAA
ncbi:Eco57I restriction-modification methylase domain-containing protein [Burkholderia vietnamiensis]|uniref:Eco57I restriction-modification methylase domain-containing protein n=1 Tax=Burkholderia vietnamiensis TaxID=60552 RepID=UPI001CF2D2B1|nr:Eco57I restriction-modification methylase domain-containing protein [Burkholderia vietnamiensis]MCA8448900.1 Eco57I restriction-modification methylase domain-containing protein [Burkholderia vietnamiensis]